VIDGRDLLDAALQGRFDAATAGDLVGAPPVLVGVGMSLEEAARTMADAGVSHVVVVENDQPAGILSTLDIAVVLAWGRA
jgi:CBS domain-containing protein